MEIWAVCAVIVAITAVVIAAWSQTPPVKARVLASSLDRDLAASFRSYDSILSKQGGIEGRNAAVSVLLVCIDIITPKLAKWVETVASFRTKSPAQFVTHVLRGDLHWRLVRAHSVMCAIPWNEVVDDLQDEHPDPIGSYLRVLPALETAVTAVLDSVMLMTLENDPASLNPNLDLAQIQRNLFQAGLMQSLVDLGYEVTQGEQQVLQECSDKLTMLHA